MLITSCPPKNGRAVFASLEHENRIYICMYLHDMRQVFHSVRAKAIDTHFKSLNQTGKLAPKIPLPAVQLVCAHAMPERTAGCSSANQRH